MTDINPLEDFPNCEELQKEVSREIQKVADKTGCTLLNEVEKIICLEKHKKENAISVDQIFHQVLPNEGADSTEEKTFTGDFKYQRFSRDDTK